MSAAMPWERVLARAAAVTGVSAAEIVGPSRRRRICQVRWAVAIALRETGLSYPRIARRLGGRDHSTIIHATREGRALMAANPAFRVLVEDLGHAARGEISPLRWVPPAVAAKPRERRIEAFDVDEREEVASARRMARGSDQLASALANYNPVIGVAG